MNEDQETPSPPHLSTRVDAMTIDKELGVVDSVSCYRKLCRQAMDQPQSCSWNSSRMTLHAGSNATCHLCGMQIHDISCCISPVLPAPPAGESKVPELMAHVACCNLRSGASPEEIYLAQRYGFWAITRVRKQDGRHLRSESPHRKWLPGFFNDWFHVHQADSADLLPGLRALDIEGRTSIRNQDGLCLVSRICYVDERELLKSIDWARYGGEIRPEWNRTESWELWENRHHGWYWAPAVKSARDLANRERSNHRPSKKERDLILSRTGGNCHFCGGSIVGPFQADHVIPFARGGPNDPSNLLAAHPWCNRARGQNGPTELSMSLLLGRWLIKRLGGHEDLPDWLQEATARYIKVVTQRKRK